MELVVYRQIKQSKSENCFKNLTVAIRIKKININSNVDVEKKNLVISKYRWREI